MVYYRLCVATEKTDSVVKYAFAFYNQHDFCVYRRVGEECGKSEREVYILKCAQALTYFLTHIRTRYYTEHFSELLDEDGGIVLCPDRTIADYAVAYREGKCAEIPEYEPLYEHFSERSVRFEYIPEHPLQKKTEELLRK